ncbi:MAG: hypothetical protein FI710_08085 [SAR202 cluster bacterium]|jgi:hypothetical protein|nr:hypothetical protein [Dehalococcoidia bacterium]MQG54952.1 hypothetical protein [SAR202 cluster bacterium]|tara:strand:+ start:2201 stop:2437 length:237 start_codon:yes stop_codon:yes gene_type:complete
MRTYERFRHIYQWSLPLEPVWLVRWSPALALPWGLHLMELLLPLLLPLVLPLVLPFLLPLVLPAVLMCLWYPTRTQQR